MKTALNRIFPTTAPATSSEAPGPGVAAPPPGVDRACPACGSAASAEQDWCLECGSRLEQPRAKWQQPAAIMASVALIFVAAIALALSEVAKDAEIAKAKTVKRYVAAPPPPAATTPPAPDAPTPSADNSPTTSKNPTDSSSPTDTSSSTPSTTDTSGITDSGGGGYVPPPSTPTDTTPAPPPEAQTWPEGKKAWTVVLLSTTSKDEATALALKARKDGVPAGILQSDTYKNLSSGLWLVWAGRFSDENAAYVGAEDFRSRGYDGESVEYIRKKGTTDSTGNGTGTGTTDTTTTTTPADGG
jgi:cell division septation protein DedD